MNKPTPKNATGNGGGGGAGGDGSGGCIYPPLNSDKQNALQKDMIILATHIHCQGCASEIIKYLRGFEGTFAFSSSTFMLCLNRENFKIERKI